MAMLPFPVAGYDSGSDDSINALDDETINVRSGPAPPPPKKGRKRKEPGDVSEVEYNSDNCNLGYLDTDLIYTSCSEISEEENESGIDQIRRRKIRKLNTFDDDSPEEEGQDDISRMLATPTSNEKEDGKDKKYTRFNCFACRFVDKKQDALNEEKVKKLLKIFEDGYGLKDNLYLARLCHLYFKNEIYLPMKKNGSNIEMWRTKHILIHFTDHIIDPRIYIGEMIRELNAIRIRNKKFLFKRVKHRNGVTEEMQNDKAIKTLLDIHSKIMLLFKAEPEKMNFFDTKNSMDLANFSKQFNTYQKFEATDKK